MARKTMAQIDDVVDRNRDFGRNWWVGLNSFDIARYERRAAREAIGSEAHRRAVRHHDEFIAGLEKRDNDRERAERQRVAGQRMAAARQAMAVMAQATRAAYLGEQVTP